jgi:biopolymer transport protein ExbD
VIASLNIYLLATDQLCLGILYCLELLLIKANVAWSRYFVATVEAFFLMHHMRVFPYVRAQHNQVDAIGHAALMLTYTITLILRNSEESFAQESFPREGYGWFILFIYVVVLPTPTIMHFCTESREKGADPGESSADFANPLSTDGDDSSTVGAFESEEEKASISGASLSKLAKISREKQELQNQLESLRIENTALLQQAPVLTSSASMQLPAAESHASDTNQHEMQQQLLSPVDPAEQLNSTMKQMVADDSLSEELRAAAKQMIEDTVSDQLADVAAQRLATQRNVVLKTIANQGRHNIQLIAAMKSSVPGSAGVVAREELMEWLSHIRLVSDQPNPLFAPNFLVSEWFLSIAQCLLLLL